MRWCAVNVQAKRVKESLTRSQRREELRAVIALSVPMVVATCTRMLMDVTDYIMVSRLPGEAQQAAMLPGQLFIWTYIVIGLGTVSIVSTFASQALGRQKLSECSAYAWQAVHLAIGFAVAGLGYREVFPALIAAVGHDPAVQAQEMAYCNVAIWTVGPSLAAGALSAFFNGVHRPKITMWAAIEGIAVNLVVSYCLIFGKLGLPQMGIAGAAAGTVVATFYRAVRLGVTMCVGTYNRQFASRSTWRLDWSKLWNLVRVGVPQGAQWFSDVVVWMIFVNVLVGRMFGTAHLIATNTVWQYLRLSFFPAVGVGMALTSLVGKSVGQGDYERAARQARTTMAMVGAYMLALGILFLTARRSLIAAFNAEPEIVAIGASIMVCAAFFQLFDAMGIVYTSALRGAGDTLWPSVMWVVVHWVVLVGGGYVVAVAAPSLGSLGPWMAATALLILGGVLLWWRWRTGKWTKIDIFGEGSARSAERRESASAADLADAVPQA